MEAFMMAKLNIPPDAMPEAENLALQMMSRCSWQSSEAHFPWVLQCYSSKGTTYLAQEEKSCIRPRSCLTYDL